jgi:hypothetical protein
MVVKVILTEANKRRMWHNRRTCCSKDDREPVMSVRAIFSEDQLVEAFSPCEQGRGLLLKFAAARPADYSFLEPRDFLDLQNSAFSGIPEWDAFAEHVSECSQCGAV